MSVMADHLRELTALVDTTGRRELDPGAVVDDQPLYDGIRRLLDDHGYLADRGRQVKRIGRVELMVGSTAVIALTWGTVRQATAEVTRIAGSQHISSVLLVTTIREHGLVPAVVKNTPVRTVVLT